MSTVFTQAKGPVGAIMSEGNRAISRANLLIGASTTVVANSLLGRIATAGAVDLTQSFSGTGNGVLTLATPAYNTKVKDGDYKVTLVTVAANAGTFRVEDPFGRSLGDVAVGVAFNKEIKFTIADGATDFALGDEFTISVAANPEDFTYAPYNPAGTDGSEVPVAYANYGCVTGVGESAHISGIVRMAELNGNEIAWPAGITAAQKADALQALETRNIIVR